jgi:hypothetical protein
MLFLLLGFLIMIFTFAVLAMNPLLLNFMPAVMLAVASFIASILLILFDAFIPYATKIFLGRLLNKDFLFLISPAKRLFIQTAKIDDNVLWVNKKLAYLISSPDDAISFAARKAFIAYTGLGYTLNPRALAEFSMLRYKDKETQKKAYEFMIAKFEELRKKFYGIEEKEEVNEDEAKQQVIAAR